MISNGLSVSKVGFSLNFLRSALMTRRKSYKWLQVSLVFFQLSFVCVIISGSVVCHDPHWVTFNPTVARLQAPEAAADKKPDQQDSDITSQETPIHTPSPRQNGSVTNFQSPNRRGNSIRTITQSASRADLNRGSVAGSIRSPTVTILPKHRQEHVPNRSHTLIYWFRQSGWL